MANTKPKPQPKREMKVLSLGLPRTGSASICKALTILGYENVYHCIDAIDKPEDWAIMNRACDASFANLLTYTAKPFTREEWDELLGASEAATDIAGIFAEPLIHAYPDAKFIYVERDYDRWFKSVDESLLGSLWNPTAQFNITYVEPLLGSVAGITARKQMLGLLDAQTVEEARRNGRATWERHGKMVRETVPPGQLLECRLGDGWGPLCEFLGCPVPDVEFPHVNETAELRRKVAEKIRAMTIQAACKILPWAGSVVALGVGAYIVAR